METILKQGRITHFRQIGKNHVLFEDWEVMQKHLSDTGWRLRCGERQNGLWVQVWVKKQ